MPAYDRCVHEFILDFRRPTINRLQIVNGDTANTFVITLKDKGKAVTLDADLHKVIAVFTRADGQIYTQDAGTGVSFTAGGVVTIDVYSSSFRTGVNNVKIQLYKRASNSDTTYPLLLTTYEQQFQGRSQAIPDSGAPNAPSQLPMLEQLISDAQNAIDDCEDATQAANNAAEDARVVTAQMTHMLENIDNEPTQGSDNLVKSGGVYSAINDAVHDIEEDHLRPYTTPLMDGIADIGGQTHQFAYEDHVHPHDTSKQDVLTFDNDPTQNSSNPVKSGGVYNALAGKQNTLTFDNAPTAGSNNPVKSGGIKTAIDAAATKNVYLVKHSTESWIENAQGVYKYQSETDDTGDELRAISADSVFASQVVLPNGKMVTANEKYRYDDIIFFESDAVDGAYVTADMNMSTPSGAQLAFTLHTDESPLVLHASTITFDEANPIKFADEYDILSVDFVESGQTLFDAIGVRPIEVILPYNGTKFRLREIATAIEDGQRTEKTVELAAAGDLLRTVPGAFSNAYMSLAVAPHAPGYLLNVSGYVVITES